jgi:hypothetical protein
MIFMLLDFLEKRKRNTPYIEIILCTKTILDLLIFIMFFISLGIKFTKVYNDDDEFYSDDGSNYKNSTIVADKYNQIFYLESLLFALTSVKVLSFLKLNDQIKLFFSSIETGIIIFAKYSIFFIVILMGYACIAQILWGPYIDQFNTFGGSFLQILLFTMGN